MGFCMPTRPILLSRLLLEQRVLSCNPMDRVPPPRGLPMRRRILPSRQSLPAPIQVPRWLLGVVQLLISQAQERSMRLVLTGQLLQRLEQLAQQLQTREP